MIDVERRNRAGSLRMFQSEHECRGFWRIALANGCTGSCVYCYLRGTLRFLSRPVLYVSKESVQLKVQNWLGHDGRYVLNTGELNDSLVFDDELGFIEWAVPMFEAQKFHVLLLLSKFDKVQPLLDVAQAMHHEKLTQTIVSWSMNTMQAWKKFEHGTSSPVERLLAAKKVSDAGYRVRLRIDPMIPVPNWAEEYSDLVKLIAEMEVKPERVTLGSLRFKPITAGMVKGSGDEGKELFEYLENEIDVGRKRVSKANREAMYLFAARELKQRIPGVEVALCKETEEFRQKLGIAGPCHCEV